MVDEIRDDLILRFENFNEKTEDEENDDIQDVAFLRGQFKGKCRNCSFIGHKAKDCKCLFRQNSRQNIRNQNEF
jgi:hypothetical protein